MGITLVKVKDEDDEVEDEDDVSQFHYGSKPNYKF